MLTVEKQKFLNAIKAIKTSCGKASLQPILSTIHLKVENGGITLTATDLIHSAKTTCLANIITPFDICVDANSLENVISCMDNIITLEVDNTMLYIKSNNTVFKLLYVQPNDFPNINFDLQGKTFIFNHDDFISGVEKTIISTKPDMGILNGVSFTFNNTGVELASTDINRLSVVKNICECDFEGQFVIPKKILLDVARVADNNIELNFVQQGINKKVIFKTNNCIFISPLLDDKFPIYQKIIPTNYEKRAIINKTNLINVLEKVAIMTDVLTNIVVLDFQNNKLEVSTKNSNGYAKDVIDIDFKGEMKLGFNYKLLLEGIKVCDTEDLILETQGEFLPCVIKSEKFIYICAPINIKNN